MAIEYLTNDTDLKAVADAIRAKTSSTDALVFPDGFVASINSLNTHSTTWDFAQRVGILTPFNETYVFDPVSQIPYLQYLSTDDTRWINGYLNRSSGTTKRPTVFAESAWAPSITDVTEAGFILNTVRTGSGILVPYFIAKGQTIHVTYTHSTTDYGGYIWCDKNGKFIDVEFVDGLGAGTSMWNYTAPTDGWIYIIFMCYDENAHAQYSNISVEIE